jgi:serine/threonine protein kinase
VAAVSSFCSALPSFVIVLRLLCLPRFKRTGLFSCIVELSTAPQRLNIARPDEAGGSLAEVFSDAPPWWTPTAKAKAIAGIALGLPFAHGLGLLHGGLKASNVLFDADRRIQIADFSPIRLETSDSEAFSGEEWSPAADVCTCASLLLRSQLAALMPSPELRRPFPRLFPQ